MSFSRTHTPARVTTFATTMTLFVVVVAAAAGQQPRDPRSDPSAPGYDPRRDPSHAAYNARTDTSHPLYDPRTDPTSPSYDPNYKPAKDPKHPLRDPKRDPGGDTKGFGADVGAADVKQLGGSWPWGEMFFGKEYPTTLEITNDCKGSQPVTVFVNNLPYIQSPGTVTVPGKSSKTVPLTIKTPPPPNPIAVPGQPTIDRNVFIDITGGNVVLWHPWSGKCLPKRIQYDASGHIHFEPIKEEPPPSDPDAKLPEKLATPDPCQVWWNTGMRPPNLKEGQDCTEAIRTLASDYRQRALQPIADRAPAEWAWLPPVERIAQMSIEALLAMKVRAQTQLEKQR